MKISVSVQAPAFVGFSILAGVLSWKLNASVLWSLFHGFTNVWYIIYALFFRYEELIGLFG